MNDLEAFLQHNVEGYLFGDLREMQRIPIGYPVLMTAFAGVELLGALLSPLPFNTFQGAVYFNSYWQTHLYPKLKDAETVGNVLYQLVRHGIAHGFVLKGPMAVVRSDPAVHLTRDSNGLIYVDAVQLANDLMASFAAHVKPLISTTTGTVNGVSMAARLKEMDTAYQTQANKLSVAAVFPIGTIVAAAPVSQSVAPSAGSVPPTGPTGPTGPSGPSGPSGVSGPTFGSKLPEKGTI